MPSIDGRKPLGHATGHKRSLKIPDVELPGREDWGPNLSEEIIVKKLVCTFGSFLLVGILGSSALGQAQRTFVSGTGSDSNTCGLTNPCLTFTRALSQTNTGGEVIVLNSAGYSPFTTSKAVSITAAPGVYAGISVTSGNGIGVSGSGVVILRGLTVENAGSTGDGIVFTGTGTLYVENCVVSGFNRTTSSAGISSQSGTLELKDSIVRGNTEGVVVIGSAATATMDHVRVEANVLGVVAQDGAQASIRNSLAADNNNGLEARTTGTLSAVLNIENCISSNNTGFGILAGGGSSGIATVRISNSIVTDNNFGLVQVGPSVLYTRGNNTVQGNKSGNTSGTITSFSAT